MLCSVTNCPQRVIRFLELGFSDPGRGEEELLHYRHKNLRIIAKS